MITLENLLQINIIPFTQTCEICNKFIETKYALGIRLDKNYYFHDYNIHSAISRADWVHKMNRLLQSM